MPDKEKLSALQTIGIGLMGFGQGMTGQSYLTNYQNIQAEAKRAKMQADLEKQKMEVELMQKGNYPINPSVSPSGGFDQSQMFSFNDKPWMKAPQQSYVQAWTMGDDGQLRPIITPNNPPGMVPKGTKIVPSSTMQSSEDKILELDILGIDKLIHCRISTQCMVSSLT